MRSRQSLRRGALICSLGLISLLSVSAARADAPFADVEQRLASLSYMVGAADGTYDAATLAGLTAFQKVEGLPVSGVLDDLTLARLGTAQTPRPAYTDPPDHIEVDIARQVIFMVRGAQVSATLPTSTGTNQPFRSQGWTRNAVTPNGQFTIGAKMNGWRRSPLGMLYRPSFFNGGIAFHGAPSVPPVPASHGCVRIPMAFADWFADNSPTGMAVFVYGGPV